MKYNPLRKYHRDMSATLMLLILLVVQGCTGLPVQNLPDNLNLDRVAASEAGTPFKPDPGGERIALDDNGLVLLELDTNRTAQLSPDSPVALAWSPSGSKLAAAFPANENSTLRIFGTEGNITAQNSADGTISDLAWVTDDILIFLVISLKNYSFGSTYRTSLWRWETNGTPALIEEKNVTIKPHTVKIMGAQLYKTAKLSISPLGDEILYTTLHDPPVIEPYLKILLRHLETGAEKEVAQVDPATGGAYLLHEDMILYSNGINEVKLLTPWTGDEIYNWQTAGRKLAVSPSGQYLLADGQLFDDTMNITNFSPGVDGYFTASGHLFIRHRNLLYRLSGLGIKKSRPLTPEIQRNLLEIRKWRSTGLINNQEFLLQQKRILEQ